MMATISGLQSPNPYAQAVPKPRQAVSQHAESATSAQAPSYHAAYSPDWMQAEHAVQGDTSALYGAKGELHKLPAASPPAQAAAQNEPTVTDQVAFSNRFSVDYSSLPGTGKP